MEKEIKQKTREQRVAKFIERHRKFLQPKQFKNTVVDVAAWGSWVQTGQCGDCILCSNTPICSIRNKRMFMPKNVILTTGKKGGCWSIHNDNSYLCDKCMKEVENQLNTKFQRYYAR